MRFLGLRSKLLKGWLYGGTLKGVSRGILGVQAPADLGLRFWDERVLGICLT